MFMKTELRMIADRLQLGEYPELLEEIFESQRGSAAPACDLDLIDALQQEHGLFGKYYDLVKKAAEGINADPDMNLWVRAAAEYCLRSDGYVMAKKLPVIKRDGSLERDFLMLMVMLPRIPVGFKRLTDHGFTKEELWDMEYAFISGMSIVEEQSGRPGIDGVYYGWLFLYLQGNIFRVDTMQFELRNLPGNVLWLKNRETGHIMPVLTKGTFHKSGLMPLGSLNYEDPEDSFKVSFEEDEDNYYGHGYVDWVVAREKQTYPKALWECVGRPGEACLGIHIPRDTDISSDITMRNCRAALKIRNERFPELPPVKAIFGTSWLLNPRLKPLQKPNSRITQFAECFVRYPEKDADAGSVFSFVFVRKPEDLNDLPEDTSLRRALKKIYLDGDGIHRFHGAIFP